MMTDKQRRKREKSARKSRRTVDTSCGLTAISYVWGPNMLEPMIEWANRLGYTYTVYAQVEEGNPNIQVVFRAVPKREVLGKRE